MDMISPNFVSLFWFLAIVICVLVCLYAGTFFASKRTGMPAAQITVKLVILSGLWLGVFCIVVLFVLDEGRPVPGVPLLLFITLLVSIAFGFSKIGTILISGISIPYLLLFQSFRLPLELVLHSWVGQGFVPQTMTWTGSNMDVISPLAAIFVYVFFKRNRRAIWFANVLGILLLINVIRVAIMSSPLPFAWGIVPPLRLVFDLPFALIVPVCVGGALVGHVVLTRALL